jgi:arabinogalactan endo-1,4-beta-galactosidase
MIAVNLKSLIDEMKQFTVIAAFISLILMTGCKNDDDPGAPAISVFHPTSGSVGIEVTISGINFGTDKTAATVMFNGTPAEITVYSPTTIKVLVPAGATTGPLHLTVGSMTTISDEHFTVLVPVAEDPSFYFGADLSYVNQILDHGGSYKDGKTSDPYEIFAGRGTDLVRLRLWHNPIWTKEIYEPDGPQLYNDLIDVAEAIGLSKDRGMKVLLDLHYSDFWADPGNQEVPAAWLNIKDISSLRDSVYNYTFKVLSFLDGKGLMPEFVQIGNEINCGMLYEHSGSPVVGFPSCNSCDGHTANLRVVLNAGIRAVRDASSSSQVKSKVILHVADPKNIVWWFDNVTAGTLPVTDFDVIGFSYYPIWHTDVSLNELANTIASVKSKYSKDVMIMETAYPWTDSGEDAYNNLFGGQAAINGFPYTPQGQYDMMTTITQAVIDGGGIGVIYWEPAWISSAIRDFWNTGSAWENCAFFDFEGNVNKGMDYIKHDYNR